MKRTLSLLLALFLLLGLAACGEKAPTWQEQYDLGQKYLTEGNYEEAILAFTAAIEIDPKNPLAYVGRGDAYWGTAAITDEMMGFSQETADLPEDSRTACENAAADYLAAIDLDGTVAEVYAKAAEAYLALGDVESAVGILDRGYEATGDEDLLTRADRLRERMFAWGSVLTRMELYDRNGTLVETIDYSYDEAGYLVRMVETDYYMVASPVTRGYSWEYTGAGGECRKIPDRENYDSDEEWEASCCDAYNSVGAVDAWLMGSDFEGYYSIISRDYYAGSLDEDGIYRRSDWDSDEAAYAKYTWNDEGDPVSIVSYYEDGTVSGSAILSWRPLNP